VNNYWKDYLKLFSSQVWSSSGLSFGPIFMMYIEILKLNSGITIMYADDTSVLSVETNLNEFDRAMTVNVGKVLGILK
jgi:hypothetical protein